MSYGPAKRKLNLRQHGIDLAEGEGVFDEPMLTREDDREAYGEQRLISRKADTHEQEAYFRAFPKG